jgi:hypothetical protein
MTSNTDRILEAFVGDAETDEDIGPHNLASALREVAIEVVLPYMQYAEWEIVNKIIEDINELADELEAL